MSIPPLPASRLIRHGACTVARALLASWVFTLPAPPAAWAQTSASSASLEPVVVTALRAAQPLSSVLADVSVLQRVDIERSGAASIADLLATLPGVEFARNGGPGAGTNVFIRGGEARHTALYIDGVRLDSQSTGGPAWEQIPLDQIERIEVLRGPAAAIYGSDAVAGVVQVFTRRGQGAPRASAALTIASQRTAQAQAGFTGVTETFDYALSAAHGRSDGFNARTAPTANPDDDGWRRSSLQAGAGWQASREHRIEASLLATRLRTQYDGSLASDDVAHHTMRTGSLGWHGRWHDEATSRLELSESRGTYETQPSFYRTETTLRNVVLQHEHRLGPHALSAIVERREDRLHNPATTSAAELTGRRTQHGVSLGWRGDFGAHGLQAHVRHDEDSEFGGQNTGSLSWGWRFAPQWRVTAAAATSFRAPTLYQRFSEYGVATLVPESGRNVELGLRWADAGQELGLNVWRNTLSNLISFGAPGTCTSSVGCYQNVGRSRYDGVTLSGRTALRTLALRASVDWHDPRNLDTDKLLARRARHLATLGADTALARWSLGLEIQAAGERFDNAANTQRLGGYGLVNLRAGTTLRPGLTLEARVNNAGDKHYELARTYNTAGRTAQLSLRWAEL
jgi:vitamin B12 transporter